LKSGIADGKKREGRGEFKAVSGRALRRAIRGGGGTVNMGPAAERAGGVSGFRGGGWGPPRRGRGKGPGERFFQGL